MYFTIAQLPYAVNISVIRRKYAVNRLIFRRMEVPKYCRFAFIKKSIAVLS
jgi:hypothetical protein